MTLLRDPAYVDEIPLESEADWLGQARSFVLEPDAELEVVLCGSCGKEASVRRWYAEPTTTPEMLCGRCAILVLGDTCGTIASVIFSLGAGDK